jgi:hypothetical protein
VNPFSFTRYYNSLGDPNSDAVTLGHNWRSTYDRYLRISGSSVIAERADGQELVFNLNGTNWTSDGDVDVKLGQLPSCWMLTNTDDTVETYNAGTSGTALLTSIQTRDGQHQTPE